MTRGGTRQLANTPERLRARLAANRGASADFDRFVLDLLAPSPGDAALDLGPGTGKQLLPLAGRVARIVGVDRCPRMVAALAPHVRAPGARVVQADMDELAGLDLAGGFSLVYAVYSLYYSADPARVVEAVASLLQGARARFVVVTPDVGNNARWHADLGRLFDVPPDVLEVAGLCREVILPALRDAFPTVTCATHRSDVRFASLDALMRYYDGCAPYCRPDRRAEARAYFAAAFERDGEYVIAKRSLGLVGRPDALSCADGLPAAAPHLAADARP